MPVEKHEDEEKTIYTEYSPLGVCGGIIPWSTNIPSFLRARWYWLSLY